MNMRTLISTARKWAAVAFSLLTSIAVAQGTGANLCQQIISEALQRTTEACRDVGRNTVCYGNRLNSIVPAPGIDRITFDEIGDQTALTDIESLFLSPLDEIEHLWGMALMKVQATLPDALPGQNVTFLLFGGVTLDTNSPSSSGVSATDGVSATGPRAFYFSTGIGQSRCAEAPADGIIVQTPEGAGMIDFTLNGVHISLGSTAVISQADDGSVGIALMEGNGIVKANGVSQILVPGAETRVLPQSEAIELRYPSEPVSINVDRFAVIQQTFSVLPRTIELPPPASERDIRQAIRQSQRIPRTEIDFINGCMRPEGWVTYKIRKGDTLSRIAGAAGTSIEELAAASCIDNPRLIVRGTHIFVPVRVARPPRPEAPAPAVQDESRRNDRRNKDECDGPHPHPPGCHDKGHCKHGHHAHGCHRHDGDDD